MKTGKYIFFQKTNSPDIFNIIVKLKDKKNLEWRFILMYATPNWRNIPNNGRKFHFVWHYSYKALKIPFIGELIYQTQ